MRYLQWVSLKVVFKDRSTEDLIFIIKRIAKIASHELITVHCDDMIKQYNQKGTNLYVEYKNLEKVDINECVNLNILNLNTANEN